MKRLSKPVVKPEFTDFALNDFAQFTNQRGEFPGVCRPSNTFAEVEHKITIFWGHYSPSESKENLTREGMLSEDRQTDQPHVRLVQISEEMSARPVDRIIAHQVRQSTVVPE